MQISEENLNKFIQKSFTNSGKFANCFDHTNLKLDASKKDIEKLCNEALDWGTASVCIRPDRVKFAKKYLGEHAYENKVLEIPKICVVISFPEGNAVTYDKIIEAGMAMKNGASELDMVLNREFLKEKCYAGVKHDIGSIVEVAKEYKGIVKVILENCELSKKEIVKACEICMDAKADYVKTSTGFKKSGATLEDVALMYRTVYPHAKVKAAGGISDAETALKMIYCGASRIGASKSVGIIREFVQRYLK